MMLEDGGPESIAEPAPNAFTERSVSASQVRSSRSWRRGPARDWPLAALEQATVRGLERSPCIVTFSGGRDSSAVLAAATRAARREGLELPIPVSFRFRDAPATREDEWQELVVRHLELPSWQRLQLDGYDYLGTVSTTGLRRHGVLFPPNAFLHRPAFAAARGGSVLTGLGGDNLLGGWRWQTLADALARRRHPRPSDVVWLAYAVLPAALRVPRELRRVKRAVPGWLAPRAARRVQRLLARRSAEEPLRWGEWVARQSRRRDLESARWSLDLFAGEDDAQLIHPLLEPEFVDALASAGATLGFGNRTAIMRALFDGLLPEPVLSRDSKAWFHEVFWAEESSKFARGWDGAAGVASDLVDADMARRAWLAPEPDFRSAMLLQAAWLASEPSQ